MKIKIQSPKIKTNPKTAKLTRTILIGLFFVAVLALGMFFFPGDGDAPSKLTSQEEARVVQLEAVKQIEGIRAIDDLNDLLYLPSRNQFWVTSFDESKIYVIDPIAWQVVDEVMVGYPHRMSLGGEGTEVWVSVGGGEMARVSTQTLTENGRVEVGKKPGAMAYDARRGEVWVANEFSDTVSLVDGQNIEVVEEIQVGRRPVDVVLDRSEEYLYAANYQDGSLSVVSLSGRVAVDTIHAVGRPNKLLAHPDQDLVLVLDQYASQVVVVDTGTNQVRDRIDVIEFPVDMVWDVEGKLWVLSFSQNRVGRVDLASKKMELAIDLSSAVGTGVGLNNLALTADSKVLVVTNTNTGKMYAVDI